MPITITAFDRDGWLLWAGAFSFEGVDELEGYLDEAARQSRRICRFRIDGPFSSFDYPVLSKP